MLLRLHKKLFKIRVKFEDLNMILSEGDFDEPVIDLGIHIQNIQNNINLQALKKDVTKAIENNDKALLKKVIENQWVGHWDDQLYTVKNEKISDVIKFSIDALGNNANLNWIDVSEVTNMSGLFSNSQFNGDISNWNASNVTDMSYMFYKNFDFESDISEWNVSKVKNMRCMFAKTYSFEQKNISNWEINDETDKTNMFLDAHSPNGL